MMYLALAVWIISGWSFAIAGWKKWGLPWDICAVLLAFFCGAASGPFGIFWLIW